MGLKNFENPYENGEIQVPAQTRIRDADADQNEVKAGRDEMITAIVMKNQYTPLEQWYERNMIMATTDLEKSSQSVTVRSRFSSHIVKELMVM